MKSMPELIECAKRELHLRHVVFRKRVLEGRMRQSTADHEIACMEQILALLEAQLQKPLL